MSKFLVWCPELGSGPEDARTVDAVCHEEAACKWARREDAESADYWIVGGDGTTVVVRETGGDEKTLRVTGEPDIHYAARVTPNVELTGVPPTDATNGE